jgi:hypothetical protein
LSLLYYYIILVVGALGVIFLFASSARLLFFKERTSLLEYMLLLHLSAVPGIAIYSALKMNIQFDALCILCIVCSIIAFAGGVWGRSQAVQNRSFPGTVGILIGVMTPFFLIGIAPITIFLVVQNLWIQLAIAIVAFSILFWAQGKLRTRERPKLVNSVKQAQRVLED